jgi:hypothetical protein
LRPSFASIWNSRFGVEPPDSAIVNEPFVATSCAATVTSSSAAAVLTASRSL